MKVVGSRNSCGRLPLAMSSLLSDVRIASVDDVMGRDVTTCVSVGCVDMNVYVAELGCIISTLVCVLLTICGPHVVCAGSVLVVVSIVVTVGEVVKVGVDTTVMSVVSKMVVCA